MSELILMVGISAIAFAVVFALLAADRRLGDVEQGVNDLISIAMAKDNLSEIALLLSDSVKRLVDENESLRIRDKAEDKQ